MFNGLLGGIVSVGMVWIISDVIEKHGGVRAWSTNSGGRDGLGGTVKSVGRYGTNQPNLPADVHRALGPDLLQQLSAKSGLSIEDLTQKLSQLLPQAVDKLTPDGTIRACTQTFSHLAIVVIGSFGHRVIWSSGHLYSFGHLVIESL